MIKHLLTKCNVKPPFCRFKFVWKKQWIVTRCIYKFSTYTLKPHPIGLIKHAVSMTKCDGVDINAAIVWSVFFFEKKLMNLHSAFEMNAYMTLCMLFFLCVQTIGSRFSRQFYFVWVQWFREYSPLIFHRRIICIRAHWFAYLSSFFLPRFFFVLWQIGFVN